MTPDVEELATAAALAVVAFRVAEEEARAAAARAGTVRDDAILALADAGWTVRRIAGELDMSTTRAQQLLTRARARRDADWGHVDPSPMRSTLLDDFRAARHAQELREEAYTGGGSEERAAFYGRLDAPAVVEAEQSLTWKAWLQGSRQLEDA